MEGIKYEKEYLVMYEIEYDKFKNVDLLSIKLIMIEIEK
jgi:hypothetical protein